AAPAAGERIVESVQPGERIQLGFDLDQTVQREVDGTVEIELPNGGVVVLAGLTDAAFSETPVEITNADGTVINLADFLVALGVSPESVETAAGPAAGPLPETVAPNQGAGFIPGQGPVILATLDARGPVDPTALRYTVPERETTLFD